MENLEILKTITNATLDKEQSKKMMRGYPHIDKPWMQYYSRDASDLVILKKTIYENFCDVVKKYGDKYAIDYLGRKITYNELKERIDIVANAFRNKGIKKGDLVSLLTANIPENVIAIYALNKIGAVANMVDLTLKSDDLISRLNDTNSTIVIATDLFLDNLNNIIDKTNVKEVIITSPFDSLPFVKRQLSKLKRPKIVKKPNYILWNEFEQSGKESFQDITEGYEENRPAAVLYTSGTTGKSKGALLTNEVFTTLSQEYRNSGLEFSVGDRFFNEEPPFISYCVNLGLNLPLSLGMCIVMFPDYQPEHYAKRVYKSKAQHVLGCPADYENFKVDKNVKKYDYSFVKTFASGGVGFEIEKKKEINNILSTLGYTNGIFEGYGMTEFGSAACTNLPQFYQYGVVGIPLPMTNVCIYDNENERELQYAEEGEVCLCGGTLMKEYLNNEEATNGTIKIHSDGERWLHTGDIGMVYEDGGVKILGRIKRLIIRYDGFDISPFEIEDVITRSSFVDDCCVVNSPDRLHGAGSVPAAYVVLKEDSDIEEALENIKSICNLNIIKRNLPQKYVLVKELPLTKLRKVDFRTLEKMEQEIEEIESNKTWVYRKTINNK